ncbi:unnamed protein product [Rotaria socialis]|uniref:Uncharacterized protein n=1 Tax=Rotaria socialis TaxID=392032 RepID=A0A818LUD3_9BILA|nr:unnamed protein product [Rotaria socialis]CAF3355702.1 unnamed protein product [Rotaria socialis]CAF3459633.1 unnamed protein product [Rotaria socialis]CAF3579020.1 unnamed protein product [Rotaria socialis]
MKNSYRNLFVLLVLLSHLQLITSYPKSFMSQQRAFLQCQFSAISCKRSVPTIQENQNLASISYKTDFEECISQNKSFWFCLHRPQQDIYENINPND